MFSAFIDKLRNKRGLLSIAALICGILGIVLLIINLYIAGVFSVLAIIFGAIEKKKIAQNTGFSGMATAALVLGIVGISLAVFVFFIKLIIMAIFKNAKDVLNKGLLDFFERLRSLIEDSIENSNNNEQII